MEEGREQTQTSNKFWFGRGYYLPKPKLPLPLKPVSAAACDFAAVAVAVAEVVPVAVLAVAVAVILAAVVLDHPSPFRSRPRTSSVTCECVVPTNHAQLHSRCLVRAVSMIAFVMYFLLAFAILPWIPGCADESVVLSCAPLVCHWLSAVRSGKFACSRGADNDLDA